jgi:anti-anti-sigma factor
MSQTPVTAVEVVVDPAGAVVTVVGDLDIASAQQFMDRTFLVLDREPGDLTVDLNGVAFCDSSGITALIKLRRRCDERGWRLHTINVQPAVRRIVVDFGGLGDYLNVR